MKKTKLTAAVLAAMCLLASCGAKHHDSFMSVNNSAKTADTQNYASMSDEAYAENAEDYYESEQESDFSLTAEAADFKQADVKNINPQMLVYSCDMSIDVLEFDDSVNKLHDLINRYKGFIENETYSDGGNTSKWQYNDEQKWKTLSTVIRIPSASYDDFCKEAENIGDMRRKNASVQNLTTEYSDLKTTLTIYEAKEKRYLDLLADMKNESDAIAVENKLTQIQVEIARLKTRMNNIENDVAYSYINLTVNEVREYTEDPVIEKTDTFGQRLMNTVSRTWRGFLEFLEELLFLIIRLLPYLLLLGIVLFPLNQLRKAIKKKRNARKAAQIQAQMNAQPEIPDTAATTGTEEKETTPKDNEADHT